MAHSYNLTGITQRPTDTQINSFIAQYPYVFPYVYESGGTVTLHIYGSTNKMSATYNSDDDTFSIWGTGIRRLNSTGAIENRSEGVVASSVSTRRVFTTEIGQPNTSEVFYTHIKTQLLSPSYGWKRYDDSDSAIKYVGNVGKETNNSHYNSTVTYLYSSDDTGEVSFSFEGTKIRLIGNINTGRSENIIISIDEESEVFSQLGNSFVGQTLNYEKTNLPNGIHRVTISKIGGSAGIDAIDIDSNGRLLHPDEVTGIKNLQVGKRVRCNYQSRANAVGKFSNLGQETSNFIPVASSNSPSGDFYYICVDRDYLGRWKLIADRNIQHSISWDTLNSEGVVSGNGANTPFVGFISTVSDFSVSHLGQMIHILSQSTASNYNMLISRNSFKTKGKYYFEMTVSKRNGTHNYSIGVCDKDDPAFSGNQIAGNNIGVFFFQGAESLSIYKRNEILYSESTLTVAGDIMSVLVDVDTRKVSFMLNGNVFGNPVDISDISNVAPMFLGLRRSGQPEDTFFVNFGQTPFKYPIPEGYLPYDELQMDYKFSSRLLTGGVSSTDIDNEWDQYIVSSSLNETITSGDNSVWNWSSGTSLTSTTVSGANTRRSRGRSSVAYYGAPASNYTATDLGYRPVLLIEQIFDNRSFIYFEGEYKKWMDNWETISQTLPSLETFKDEGMDDLSVLDRKVKTHTIKMDDNSETGEILGSGKMFREKIDLKKYFDLISIKTK